MHINWVEARPISYDAKQCCNTELTDDFNLKSLKIPVLLFPFTFVQLLPSIVLYGTQQKQPGWKVSSHEYTFFHWKRRSKLN